MNTLKAVGVAALGLTVVAALGGGAWWAYRRYKRKQEGDGEARPGPVPSKPPRVQPEPATDSSPRGDIMDLDDLPPEFEEELNRRFPNAWPPKDEVVDNLTTEDVVVFAVESEPVEGYDQPRQEVISAKVLSVEKTQVRGRVLGPVAYAEHHGAHAGHGFRVGDLIEIPRSKILVAARSTEPIRTGYNSKGKAVQTFKSSHETKQTYRVRPATPYDLVLPYRTAELEWYVDREMVKLVRIGERGLIEQIMFTEDSMRGPVTVRALDNDPKEGLVFVARWDFAIDP